MDVGGWNGTDGRAKILIRARGEWMLERQQRGTKRWITSGKTIRFTPESREEAAADPCERRIKQLGLSPAAHDSSLARAQRKGGFNT